MEEERKKENSTELQKPNTEAEVYSNNETCDWMYTYTSTSKVKMVQQKYSKVTQRTKEIKNYIYQLRTKLTKHKLENKIKQGAKWGIKQWKQN